MTEQHLAYFYGVSLTTISKILSKWIPVMYRRFRLLNIWPSKENSLNTMPCSIAMKLPDMHVIIDCTEMGIPTPKNPIAQQLIFSNYTNCHTAKVLIGISPSGAISCVSDMYGGV